MPQDRNRSKYGKHPADPKKSTTKARAPLSIRLGDDRESRVKAYQKAKALTQSSAIHTLVDAGLEAFGFGPEKSEEAPKAHGAKWDVL